MRELSNIVIETIFYSSISFPIYNNVRFNNIRGRNRWSFNWNLRIECKSFLYSPSSFIIIFRWWIREHGVVSTAKPIDQTLLYVLSEQSLEVSSSRLSSYPIHFSPCSILRYPNDSYKSNRLLCKFFPSSLPIQMSLIRFVCLLQSLVSASIGQRMLTCWWFVAFFPFSPLILLISVSCSSWSAKYSKCHSNPNISSIGRRIGTVYSGSCENYPFWYALHFFLTDLWCNSIHNGRSRLSRGIFILFSRSINSFRRIGLRSQHPSIFPILFSFLL